MQDKLTSHYPDFDVMNEQDHWDDHTRQIIVARLHPGKFKTLSSDEVMTLTHLSYVLLYEKRPELINYVVHHFDQSLSADIGQSQRKKGIPKKAVLIREGLRALDQYCTAHYGMLFAGLQEETQHNLLDQLMRANITLTADGISIPAKEFFTTILNDAVSAYYSHPVVWSEIGYAGPAYPRGYVRSEWGVTDPWEAKRKNEK